MAISVINLLGTSHAVQDARIPTVTSSDDGKILMVVSGAWAAGSVSSAASGESVSDDEGGEEEPEEGGGESGGDEGEGESEGGE